CPPPPARFPYTTLFRSGPDLHRPVHQRAGSLRLLANALRRADHADGPGWPAAEVRWQDEPEGRPGHRPAVLRGDHPGVHRDLLRSEEHTSELQSRFYLV